MTQEFLKEVLHYDHLTGHLTWKTSSRKNQVIGERAERCTPSGYAYINMLGFSFNAHRVAWYYVHGFTPDMLDHINGVKADNRLSNLRIVTARQNSQNQEQHRNGKLIGTTWHKRDKKWIARLVLNNKKVCLGYFDTELEAHAAYVKAVEKLKK